MLVNLFHLFNPLDAVHIPNGHIHRQDSLVLRHFDPALSLSVPDDPSGCHFACKIHLVQHHVVWSKIQCFAQSGLCFCRISELKMQIHFVNFVIFRFICRSCHFFGRIVGVNLFGRTVRVMPYRQIKFAINDGYFIGCQHLGSRR